MSRRWILLIATMLAPCALCNPTPDTFTASGTPKQVEMTSTVSSVSTNNEESQNNKLEFFLLDEFMDIIDLILTREVKLFEDVIADVNAKDDHSEDLISITHKMSDLLNKFKKLDAEDKNKQERKLDLVLEFNDLLNSFDIDEKPDEVLYIEASLKKRGLEKIRKEVREKFLEFTDKFYGAVDKFWGSLDPTNQAGYKPYVEWLRSFKDETDIEKKLTTFAEIFELKKYEK